MSNNKKIIITECDYTQTVDMFKKWTEVSASAKSVVEKADEILLPILSARLSDIFSSSSRFSEADRNRVEVRQAGVFTATMASYACLLEQGKIEESDVLAVAGYSLGDIGALCVAGSLPFETGLQFVFRQGKIMSERAELVNGSFLISIGMAEEKLWSIIERTKKHGEVLEICNESPGLHFSMAGSFDAISRTHEELMARSGEGVISLHVPQVGPWHCSLMEGGQSVLQEEINKLELFEPRCPVLSSITGRPYTTSNMKTLLEAQLCSRLNWKKSIDYLTSEWKDVDWIQLAPGDLMYKTLKHANVEFPVQLAEDILSDLLF